jgi:hypothetical protein
LLDSFNEDRNQQRVEDLLWCLGLAAGSLA